MTTTPKGYTELTNASAMSGPEQINAAERFVENLIGESVATAADLPASGNWIGRTITVQDVERQYVWLGTWKRLGAAFAEAAGVQNYSGAGGSSSAPLFWDNPVTVTFPAGRFTVPPIVTVSGRENLGVVAWPWIASAPTTTGFTVACLRVGAAPTNTMSFSWEAKQMTAASAAG